MYFNKSLIFILDNLIKFVILYKHSIKNNKQKKGEIEMIANLETAGTVHTHTHTHTHTIHLEDKIIVSFLCLEINLILSKIINRVKFVYLSELKKAI